MRSYGNRICGTYVLAIVFLCSNWTAGAQSPEDVNLREDPLQAGLGSLAEAMRNASTIDEMDRVLDAAYSHRFRYLKSVESLLEDPTVSKAVKIRACYILGNHGVADAGTIDVVLKHLELEDENLPDEIGKIPRWGAFPCQEALLQIGSRAPHRLLYFMAAATDERIRIKVADAFSTIEPSSWERSLQLAIVRESGDRAKRLRNALEHLRATKGSAENLDKSLTLVDMLMKAEKASDMDIVVDFATEERARSLRAVRTILEAESTTDELKARACQILGRYRDLAAAKSVLRHVDLELRHGASVGIDGIQTSDSYPCQSALFHVGEAAVPDLLNFLGANESPKRRELAEDVFLEIVECCWESVLGDHIDREWEKGRVQRLTASLESMRAKAGRPRTWRFY